MRFKSISNFRDLGGYKTGNGGMVAWRRVFRSGELARIDEEDYRRLKEEIKLATVIDLRSDFEIERQGIGLSAGTGIKYHNVSFLADGGNNKADEQRYRNITNMGEFYVLITRNKGFGTSIVKALEIIAERQNHPLVFNCTIGKDRTGILAGILLSALGVEDRDIIEDYTLSGPYVEVVRQKLISEGKMPEEVKPLPDFFWKASPESMKTLLNALRRDFGSIESYLESMGSADSLTERLKAALLV